jgi:hypothetical protein
MTEQEWLAAEDPAPMFGYLRNADKLNERRCRLFACACVRRVWHLLSDDRSRRAVEVAEDYADGLASDAELAEAESAAVAAGPASLEKERRLITRGLPRGLPVGELFGAMASVHASYATGYMARQFDAGFLVVLSALQASYAAGKVALQKAAPENRSTEREAGRLAEQCKQAGIARDIFGNPLRCSPTINPSWRIPAVLALAEEIYATRSFERSSELADALEAAGCSDPEILEHLRGPGPHVKGCSVVDLILSKQQRGLTSRASQRLMAVPICPPFAPLPTTRPRRQPQCPAIALHGQQGSFMPGSGYASRTEAIHVAEEAMRATYGAKIRFEAIPPGASFPRSFRVVDDKRRQLESFRVFKVATGGIQEWAWQESGSRP